MYNTVSITETIKAGLQPPTEQNGLIHSEEYLQSVVLEVRYIFEGEGGDWKIFMAVCQLLGACDLYTVSKDWQLELGPHPLDRVDLGPIENQGVMSDRGILMRLRITRDPSGVFDRKSIASVRARLVAVLSAMQAVHKQAMTAAVTGLGVAPLPATDAEEPEEL